MGHIRCRALMYKYVFEILLWRLLMFDALGWDLNV